jgi:hypothetical protein
MRQRRVWSVIVLLLLLAQTALAATLTVVLSVESMT